MKNVDRKTENFDRNKKIEIKPVKNIDKDSPQLKNFELQISFSPRNNASKTRFGYLWNIYTLLATIEQGGEGNNH
ncbi:hypothetical protein [Planococcus chinensis]|uniref:hypothetical protein n=1 Tax=Planococcus chinensis TaxID=272917 RepID=UPI001CC55108|nr:hypothetical protein [Planococcus chinensis]